MSDSSSLAQKQNQRVHERRPLRSKGLLVVDRSDPMPFDTIDIGHGGLGIVFPKQLQIGQRCFVKFVIFVIGRKYDIVAAARVSHSVCGKDGFKTGLQFMEMEQVFKDAVIRFMET